MDTFILPLDSYEATLAKVGGKGVNLARMLRANFPVPPGFHVTTESYCAFVQANDLQKRIIELASNAAKTSEIRSAEIRDLFAKGNRMPLDVTEAIRHAYAKLTQAVGDVSLAVRSSATAEDLTGASFAGQQDTYLNVLGEQALIEAIQRCWSSLWTARALEYRSRYGINPSIVSLAVVVQVMVPAEVAGIMFTANPINGARDEIVIDASWGLGEAIVGGLVTPDHVVVEKSTGVIKQMKIGDKATMTQPTITGTEEHLVEANRRQAAVLEANQVIELARIGTQIENYFGQPQDIEWCLAKGKIYVVQARPITTLPESDKWVSPIPDAKWLKDLQAGEWATEPLSPLGATTTFAVMITTRQQKFPLQKRPWHALVNGWLYIRADYSAPLIPILLEFFLRYLRCVHNGRTRVLKIWTRKIGMLDSLEQIDQTKLSNTKLFAHADQLLNVLGWWWWEVTLYAAVSLFGEQFIGKIKISGLTDPAVLFRGNDSLLLEAERALRQAVTSGKTDTYLARFGHFVESADPIHPTLREAPNLFHQHLAIARQNSISPDERLLRTRHERAEAENLIRKLPGLRGILARWMLNAGQSHAAYTDDAVFHFQRVLALVRATLLEVGRRMKERGILEKTEDIFYLEYEELREELPDRQELVNQRRSRREIQKRLAPPPYIPPLTDPAWGNDRSWKLFSTSLGETVLQRGMEERDGKKIIVGTPGSPGQARGIARVITGTDDFGRFQPGNVLVAHTTTPVWTPLFNIASAAVTEVGGPFSHAAIVAREFGIPLVNGALDATQVIHDGMPIFVDGSAGVVELLDVDPRMNPDMVDREHA